MVTAPFPDHEALLGTYVDLRIKERMTPAESRRSMHIHYREAAAYEKRLQKFREDSINRGGAGVHLPGDPQGDEDTEPFVDDLLSNEALQAKDDFGYFRKRYFGRRATPWQEMAANDLLEFLTTPNKEYVVVNCPPGSGKSTLFAHDIPVWLAVRNRALRCLIGSYTERQAIQYIGRIRRTFVRRTPMDGAESTLLRDFGGFRPLQRDLWRVNEFVIAQVGEVDYSEKEPSFSAFGYDSAFLGGRYDLVVWDDLVDRHTLRSSDAMIAMEGWWGSEAETRCEPSGLVVLQGQRMAPLDLYRHSLGLKLDDGTPKYHHIVYKAHDEGKCEGKHSKGAPYWPEGCLLDPVRLSWRDIAAIKRNSHGRYRTLYQQEDIDTEMALVQQLWLDGGQDNTSNSYPGCFDKQRRMGQLPPNHENLTALVTVDPSPSKNWGVILWAVDPYEEFRYVVDMHNGPLQISDFLDYSFQEGDFSGLMERWYRRYEEMGLRIRFLIIEVNAAQKWAIQSRHMQQWASTRGVALIPHTTTIMKNSPEFGVQALAPLFRYGKVRLPYKDENKHLQDFIDQLLTWPMGRFDDLVMSAYFLEAQWRNVSIPLRKTPTLWRPAWLRDSVNGRGLVNHMVNHR